MKRVLALLLAVLLLSGCTAQPVETTAPTETTQPTTVPTEPRPVGLYQENSNLEQQTNGAVHAYPLKTSCKGIRLMGSDVLVLFDGERTQLHAYAGEELILKQSSSLYPLVSEDGTGLQTYSAGLSHYDAATQTLVLLDADLRETARITLPGDIQGQPVVSPDMKNVYFCAVDGIRVLNVENGITRILRQQGNHWQELTNICFDGTLLACLVEESNGQSRIEFIQTQNGQLIASDAGLEDLYVFGNDWFLRRHDENGSELLYGTIDEGLRAFALNQGTLIPALPIGGILVCTEESLDFYDLESGLRSASLALTELPEIRDITPDPRGYVWFLAHDEQANADVLCRWEIAKSPTEDTTVYTDERYTESNPDMLRLEACQDRATAIGDSYGIVIRTGLNALMEPWENCRAEHRVSVVNESLTQLEELLSVFPEGFLERLGWISDRGVVTISLVREMHDAPGKQIWYRGSPFIALEIGEDMKPALYKTLYQVIDTYVLDENSMLDEWDAPQPTQDRTQLFLDAMAENNAEKFADDALQSKLYQLCRAIRYAFGLRRYEASLPWEQYLNEPLY